MIGIEISKEAADLARKLGGIGTKAGPAIALAMDIENQLTIRHISQYKLSQKGENTLADRSNRLRSSVRASMARVTGTEVESTIASNVKYAAVHEYGCGPYTIRARKGKALRWATPGGVRFARTVRHPGFPARRMFQSGIEERADKYSGAISAAIIKELLS